MKCCDCLFENYTIKKINQNNALDLNVDLIDKKQSLYRISILIFFLLGSLSCGDDVEPLFQLVYDVDFTIDPGLNTIDTHVYTIRNVPSFLEDFALANNVNPDSIVSAAPNRATITTIFQNIDYNFLDQLSVWMVSVNNPNDSREIFFLDFVDLDEDSEVRLLSSIANVIDYLREGSFNIEVRLRLRSFSPAEINSRLSFDITAFD